LKIVENEDMMLKLRKGEGEGARGVVVGKQVCF
jgi:hypothetical protein